MMPRLNDDYVQNDPVFDGRHPAANMEAEWEEEVTDDEWEELDFDPEYGPDFDPADLLEGGHLFGGWASAGLFDA